MNAAEQLKKELIGGMPITKEQFIDAVMNAIRMNGRYSYYIEERGNPCVLTNGPHFSPAYSDIIKGWAREEGFNVERWRGGTSVIEYDITL